MMWLTRLRDAQTFPHLARRLVDQARRGGGPDHALRTEVRRHLTGPEAARWLEWLASHPLDAPAQLIRAVQELALSAVPMTTQANTTDYEWAGATLQRLLGTTQPVAETWPFFSDSKKPATIAHTNPQAGPVTMEELVASVPEILGPAGMDHEHQNQKYFFVKFLDPSDFPPFAYVGFHPDAVAALHKNPEALKAHMAGLLLQDRQNLEAYAALVRPAITSLTQFGHLKTAYKQWAIAQAREDWTSTAALDGRAFVPPERAPDAQELLRRQQAIRRQITGLLHRIDFADDQAILIESPTLHAIAGLSLQLHPRVRGNFHPKDELWIYKRIADVQGRPLGWVLVEPQRTFDVTESGADFFTPFAWRNERLEFRKTLPQAFAGWKEYVDYFVSLMDAKPRVRSHYVRTAIPMEVPGHAMHGAAQWYRLVEEEGWPYFLARELRFTAPGWSRGTLAHHCFIELHATQGTVEIALRGGRAQPLTCMVSPAQPVFLPASLPYETIEYRARGPAQLLFFTRPQPKQHGSGLGAWGWNPTHHPQQPGIG